MNNFKILFITIGLMFSMSLFANPIFSDDLLKRATNGDTSAQLELADVYIYGWGIEENETQAEFWATKSAESGNVKAMQWLGEGYATYAGLVGDMDPADADEHYKKAFKWFSKGTQLNDADCMVGLANLYSSGDGVEQDTYKALELRKKAAALGNKQAMRDIAFMYKYGLGVEKNLEIAKYWSEKGKI
ncbi:tetratricopeptide repeat protein [Acinetobacter baumannii]|uniref:tetratricopeptide repeat protein n=1 Tax=Acinetobacter baumannii TaxID=470 RepID=UPI0029563EA2|nr:tetratricopeptide repeat protein [Acinetobacter baumannii]HAV5497954.1 sel1 repeat family protein [Acinetobacter baumannii]